MPKYMVIETFRTGCKDAVYDRLKKQGRKLPDGLHYIESWLEKDGPRCFQLMETESPSLFDTWIKSWNDLVDFDIVELGPKPDDTCDSPEE